MRKTKKMEKYNDDDDDENDDDDDDNDHSPDSMTRWNATLVPVGPPWPYFLADSSKPHKDVYFFHKTTTNPTATQTQTHRHTGPQCLSIFTERKPIIR